MGVYLDLVNDHQLYFNIRIKETHEMVKDCSRMFCNMIMRA